DRRIEAVALVGLRGLSRVGRIERNVIEVVLRVRRRLDQDQLHAFGELELRLSRRELRDAQGDMLERALLARPLRVEERELAAPSIGADEREVVLPVDDVQAELR